MWGGRVRLHVMTKVVAQKVHRHCGTGARYGDVRDRASLVVPTSSFCGGGGGGFWG